MPREAGECVYGMKNRAKTLSLGRGVDAFHLRVVLAPLSLGRGAGGLQSREFGNHFIFAVNVLSEIFISVTGPYFLTTSRIAAALPMKTKVRLSCDG